MPTVPSRSGAAADETAADDDSNGVLVGHIQGAWGVRGEVRVVAQSSHASALLHTKRWHLVPVRRRAAPGADPRTTREAASAGAREPAPAALASSVRDVKARRHGADIVAHIDGVTDRDAAQALAGAQVRIARTDFPRTADDEYYWVDLIGCRVVNRQGEALGEVTGLIDTGVHSVLRVQARDVETAGPGERLVPFVAAYVDEVDLAACTIRVDWGRDY
jgi:16S rRNA processing protein RimM